MPQSVGKRYEYFDDAGLRSDEPVDTARAFTLADNLCHMHDVAPQYRVNWVWPVSAVQPRPFGQSVGSLLWGYYFAFEWPVTMSRPGRTGLPRWDVRLAAGVVGAGTVTAWVTFFTCKTSRSFGAATGDQLGSILSGSGGAGMNLIIDGSVDPNTSTSGVSLSPKSIKVTDPGGQTFSSYLSVQCGLVILTFADSSDAFQIGEFH